MTVKIVMLTFIIISIINSYLDLKTMQISLLLNYIGIAVALITYLIDSPQLLLRNLIGGIILFLIFLFVWKITHKGLGAGDIHYSLFCGLISGFPGFLIAGIITSIIGLAVFFVIKISGRQKSIKNMKIPFIPIMFAGTLGVGIFPESLIMQILTL